ncbi:hypothetical protein DIPPA_09335 [Diplonema papillatum]|nr:hypothetical protein DIPPA_09335 [Diplonema papillatum]
MHTLNQGETAGARAGAVALPPLRAPPVPVRTDSQEMFAGSAGSGAMLCRSLRARRAPSEGSMSVSSSTTTSEAWIARPARASPLNAAESASPKLASPTSSVGHRAVSTSSTSSQRQLLPLENRKRASSFGSNSTTTTDSSNLSMPNTPASARRVSFKTQPTLATITIKRQPNATLDALIASIRDTIPASTRVLGSPIP